MRKKDYLSFLNARIREHQEMIDWCNNQIKLTEKYLENKKRKKNAKKENNS